MSTPLKSTLDQIRVGLQGYFDVEASERFLNGDLPSIGDLIALADRKLELLYELWDHTIEELNLENDKYVVTPDHPVPTASPRQLLISVLVNHPVILEKLSTGGDAILVS
ncbi:MAG: hypothetical protein M1840_003499 [Geoglossum simile]|nr:MAG: hypothetical protein M1840_003499 [Geoglossum simile]